MKQYLQQLKQRAQLIILLGNTLLVSLNILYTAHKFDNINNKQIFACQLTSPITSVCYEQQEVNNNNKRDIKTQDEINRSAHFTVETFFNDIDQSKVFILKDDPLFKYDPIFCPHENCNNCDHNKYYLEYHYKRWDTGKKRLSHFGILKCDKCGTSITWVNKYLRDAVIKKNNLNIAEID